MIIHTIKGVLYAVTAQGECVVSAPVESNGYYTLAQLPEGGQAVVQATGDHMVVSDDAARVVQYLEHNSFEAHVSNADVHLSEADREAFESHVSNTAVHLSTEEREAMYRTKVTETPMGDSNANFNWFEVAGVWISAGKLRKVMYKCRSDWNGMTTDARYLGVFEQVEGDVFVKVGVSKNAQVQEANGEPEWVFDGVSLKGAPLRFVLLANMNDGWNTSSVMGARVAPIEDGSFLQGGSRLQYIPQMRIDVDELDKGRKLRDDEATFLEYLMTNRAFPIT